MLTLQLEQKKVDLAQFVKRSAMESDYSRLISESCMILDAEGKVKVLYFELGEAFDTQEVIWALQTIKYSTSTRTSGLKTTSAIFGYSPRVTIRRDFCTSTSMATKQRQQHEIICDFGKKLAEIYQEFIPNMYKVHEEATRAKVKDEWIIEGTPFTSGIVNKNNPLKYHFDSGNFKGVYSNMVVFKKSIEGGYLSCPEYDLAFELKNNSILMFDGQSILHGVTPIRRLRPDAYRYSIVYYSLQGMWKCETVGEELARIKKVKTQREHKRLTL